MRLLCCGSRTWADKNRIDVELQRLNDHTSELLIIHGACPTGADNLVDQLATTYEWQIKKYEAEWDRRGKRAGPVRNQKMITFGKPDQGLAFGALYKHDKTWGWKRSGSGDMTKRMIEASIPVRWISTSKAKAVDLVTMPEVGEIEQEREEECDCMRCQINGNPTH